MLLACFLDNCTLRTGKNISVWLPINLVHHEIWVVHPWFKQLTWNSLNKYLLPIIFSWQKRWRMRREDTTTDLKYRIILSRYLLTLLTHLDNNFLIICFKIRNIEKISCKKYLSVIWFYDNQLLTINIWING